MQKFNSKTVLSA